MRSESALLFTVLSVDEGELYGRRGNGFHTVDRRRRRIAAGERASKLGEPLGTRSANSATLAQKPFFIYETEQSPGGIAYDSCVRLKWW